MEQLKSCESVFRLKDPSFGSGRLSLDLSIWQKGNDILGVRLELDFSDSIQV